MVDFCKHGTKFGICNVDKQSLFLGRRRVAMHCARQGTRALDVSRQDADPMKFLTVEFSIQFQEKLRGK
ncbi:MAG: hypothetical protein PHU43_02125 [Candidatus Bipolaricaulis sp.]|nr:hypothetical protein [Candidatus Bipolaricaulis sp.]